MPSHTTSREVPPDSITVSSVTLDATDAAPDWPGPSTSALIHLDFLVDDLEATEARALTAGARRFDARRLDEQPNEGHCLVLADPDGHPFCLTTVDELR